MQKIKKRRWKNKEDEFLRDNHRDMTMREMAEVLDRTYNAVCLRMILLGFTAKSGRPRVYAIYKKDELLGIGTKEELAHLLGLSKRTIDNYLCKTRRAKGISVIKEKR